MGKIQAADIPGRDLKVKGIQRAIICLVLVFISASLAAAEKPGKAAIASAHYLATEAGHEILAQGPFVIWVQRCQVHLHVANLQNALRWWENG